MALRRQLRPCHGLVSGSALCQSRASLSCSSCPHSTGLCEDGEAVSDDSCNRGMSLISSNQGEVGGVGGGRGQDLCLGDSSPAEPTLPLPFLPSWSNPEAEAKASPKKPSGRRVEQAPTGSDCFTMRAGPKILNHT